MNIRKEVINYKVLLIMIEDLDIEIDSISKQIKNLEPSSVQIMTGMPFTHNADSKIESMVIDILDNNLREKYKILQKEIRIKIDMLYELKRKKILIDAELRKLNKEKRGYLEYYTSPNIVTHEMLAEKYHVDYDYVKVKITRVLNELENQYKSKSA